MCLYTLRDALRDASRYSLMRDDSDQRMTMMMMVVIFCSKAYINCTAVTCFVLSRVLCKAEALKYKKLF